MTFLAPVWLFLAGAVAVPLLLHLMRRRTGARVDFPAVRYLVRAEKEHSRRLRLRNLLLMLLRVLAVLLVALAAARPAARLAGTGHAATAVALVVDNSLSSSAVADGRPVLEALRAAGLGVLAAAGAADRAWLVTADGQVQGGTPARVASALRDVAPLAGAGDPAAAARRATELVAGAGLEGAAVVVLTDAQASSWREPARLGERASVVAFVPSAAPPVNRAVVAAEARPASWTPTGAVAAAVLAGADSTTYRVTLGGRTLARGTVAPSAAGSPAELLVHATPPERGWLAGTVEIEPDELRGDDVRHWAAWAGPPPRVAVAASAGPFVRTAVDALAADRRVAIGAGIAIAEAGAVARLPAVLLAPADPVRLGAANRALERLGVPWRFGAVRRGDMPLRGRLVEGAAARVRWQLVPQPGAAADTLATASGEAWAVAGPGYLLVASPLDAESGTLPLRAGFVPWLGAAIAERLGGAAGPVVAAAPAAMVAAAPGATALVGADGASSSIAGATLRAPTRPGVYYFIAGAQRVGALIVNPEREESVLRRLTDTELGARLGGRRARVVRDAGALAAATFDTGTRRPLAAPLLVAALLLLAAESVVARGRRGGVA